MASATADLRLPSQPQGITAPLMNKMAQLAEYPRQHLQLDKGVL